MALSQLLPGLPIVEGVNYNGLEDYILYMPNYSGHYRPSQFQGPPFVAFTWLQNSVPRDQLPRYDPIVRYIVEHIPLNQVAPFLSFALEWAVREANPSVIQVLLDYIGYLSPDQLDKLIQRVIDITRTNPTLFYRPLMFDRGNPTLADRVAILEMMLDNPLFRESFVHLLMTDPYMGLEHNIMRRIGSEKILQLLPERSV